METPKSKTLYVVGIYIWKGKAYVPIQDKYESGLYVDSEPVYVVALKHEEMTRAIQVVKDIGHRIIPNPKSREEFIDRKDPILSATGARSWRKLAKEGAGYSIGWTAVHVRIDMSRLDRKGIWENDPDKKRILPPDTSIEEIVEIILEDVKTRPEVFG